MKFLDINYDLSELEEGVRNVFRWNWLECIDCNEDAISKWCKKTEKAGQVYCTYCSSTLQYGGEGIKALTNHAETATHKRHSKVIKNSMSLSHYGNARNVEELVENDDRPLDITTRKARQEVIISSFIAENNLCFSMAPKLIELSQTLSQDSSALKSLNMSRTTASYKLKYGIAKTVNNIQQIS